MNAVFADTFYWIAFTNVRDLAHERAKALILSLLPQIVTTEEVLIEYLNYFAGWGRSSGARA
jgi:predicted nucleic acid-binding protein